MPFTREDGRIVADIEPQDDSKVIDVEHPFPSLFGVRCPKGGQAHSDTTG